MEKVIKTHVYGIAPYDIYTVSYDGDKTVATSEPTLDALASALGEAFIPLGEVESVMDSLATASGSTYSDEDRLEFAKAMAKRAIGAYDTSAAVNAFYLVSGDNRIEYWLPAEKRGQLITSVNIWSETHDNYTLDLREYGTSFSLPCNTLLGMLGKLDSYAVECYNTTSAHQTAILGKLTVAEVVAYDYTAGYPEKLEFEASPDPS